MTLHAYCVENENGLRCFPPSLPLLLCNNKSALFRARWWKATLALSRRTATRWVPVPSGKVCMYVSLSDAGVSGLLTADVTVYQLFEIVQRLSRLSLFFKGQQGGAVLSCCIFLIVYRVSQVLRPSSIRRSARSLSAS